MVHPFVFGILNITEDSFSDGARFLDPVAARAHAKKLIADGADALDLGAASSNPRAKPVPPETEIARLKPIVAYAKKQGWKVSVDSFAQKTQLWALSQGADTINDIRGFPDPKIYPNLAASTAKLVVMHAVQGQSQGHGQGSGKAQIVDTDPATIMGRIADFFDARIEALTASGIARDRLILDPGMGLFVGKKPEVSLAVLRGLKKLKSAFRLPILVSVSRKSFLRKLAGRELPEIGPASLAAELFAGLNGADMIRTHEPKPLRDALTIWRHITGHERRSVTKAGNP